MIDSQSNRRNRAPYRYDLGMDAKAVYVSRLLTLTSKPHTVNGIEHLAIGLVCTTTRLVAYRIGSEVDLYVLERSTLSVCDPDAQAELVVEINDRRRLISSRSSLSNTIDDALAWMAEHAAVSD